MNIGDTFIGLKISQPTNAFPDIIKVKEFVGRRVKIEFLYGWAGTATVTQHSLEHDFKPISAEEISKYLPNRSKS